MKKRKQLIVDKKFQYSLVLNNLILLFITFALIAVALLVWENYQTKQGFLIRLPQNSEVVTWAKANNVKTDSAQFLTQFIRMAKVYTFFDLLWKPLAAMLVLNVIILIIANLYFSNTIVGPIHRLKDVLERKLRGEAVEPVAFRKNDEFHDLAELVNQVICQDYQKKNQVPKIKE
jgi:methyl-accepting chemotaxis protein